MVRHKGVGCQSINRMSAFGPRKRTSSDTTGLSALCPIANIGALHSITSSGAREKRGGTVRPSALAHLAKELAESSRICHARFPPQTAKRWPGFRHKPRNRNLCGEVRLKQTCGRC
jgi:hypothetical protein